MTTNFWSTFSYKNININLLIYASMPLWADHIWRPIILDFPRIYLLVHIE